MTDTRRKTNHMMRILVGWDDTAEAETIKLLLDIDDNVVEVVTDGTQFEQRVTEAEWDVLVQAIGFPNRETALSTFQRNQERAAETPVIGIYRQSEIADLARFLSHHLHAHLMRDPDGNFMFLLTSMAQAAVVARQSRQAARLAEQLRQEVDSVKRLQDSVIPRELPQPEGYRIAARYESSQIHISGIVPVAMAGGDYYDIFSRDDHTLTCIVGDASGHGIKACMSIMTMHTLIRMTNWEECANTGQFVEAVNRRLCDSDIIRDEGGFIALLFLTLDQQQHRFQWTSAGSPMPLLQNLETNHITNLRHEDYGGLPLAIDDHWQYEHFSMDFPQHSRLILYTDGLEDAFPLKPDDHAPFGINGIITSLQSSAHLPVDAALEKLFADSHAFTQGHGRMDDTSVVIIERCL